jgi:molecular chaperone GrpE
MIDEMDRLKRAATSKIRPEDTRLSERSFDRPAPEPTDVWKDRYLRLHADVENTKKRLARSSAQEVEAQKEALLRELLPVADGLDLALMHTPDQKDNRGILQGIEMVQNILNKFFADHGVKAIDAWGKPFDPRLHEAIGVMSHPKFPPNTAVKVEQKGYLYGDKLLRPAQVVVTPSEGPK